MLEIIESGDMMAFQHYALVRVSIVLICWLFMAAACCIDFWSGTTTAKAIGQKISSHKFRRTIAKMGDYIKLQIFALMLDLLGSLFPFWVVPYASILCAIAIMLIEGKSVLENSRKRKTHAADVPEVIKQIVQAATTKQGQEVLDNILKTVKSNKEGYNYESSGNQS